MSPRGGDSRTVLSARGGEVSSEHLRTVRRTAFNVQQSHHQSPLRLQQQPPPTPSQGAAASGGVRPPSLHLPCTLACTCQTVSRLSPPLLPLHSQKARDRQKGRLDRRRARNHRDSNRRGTSQTRAAAVASEARKKDEERKLHSVVAKDSRLNANAATPSQRARAERTHASVV